MYVCIEVCNECLYVCRYLCMYVLYLCMYVLNACIMYVGMYVFLCMYLCVYVFMCVCIYVCIYECTYVYMYTCMWLRIRMYYPSPKYISLQTISRKAAHKITRALLFLNAKVSYPLNYVSTQMHIRTHIHSLSPKARFRFHFSPFVIFYGYRNTGTGLS